MEYGNCRKESVTGDISLLEIYFSPGGVSKINFSDRTKIWSLGQEEANFQTQRHYFNDNEKWIGLHGTETEDGI